MRLVGPVTIYRPPQCHLRKRSRVERSRGALCPRRSRRSSRQPCEAPWHERDAHEGLFASMSHARRSPRRAPSTQVSCTPLLPNDGRGVQGRELMARAGERDDRDAHEGLLASMSRARRSPLVSRCRLTCRSCCAHRAFERQCGCSLQRHAVACVVARANGMIETLTKVFSLRFARAPLASRVALQADVQILLSCDLEGISRFADVSARPAQSTLVEEASGGPLSEEEAQRP